MTPITVESLSLFQTQRNYHGENDRAESGLHPFRLDCGPLCGSCPDQMYIRAQTLQHSNSCCWVRPGGCQQAGHD